jgi:hypothetical protein
MACTWQGKAVANAETPAAANRRILGLAMIRSRGNMGLAKRVYQIKEPFATFHKTNNCLRSTLERL